MNGNGGNGNGNGFWKAAAMFEAGVILAMVSFYVAEFKRTITREDAIELIEVMRPPPPWAQDRADVFHRLDDNDQMIAELRRQLLEPRKR